MFDLEIAKICELTWAVAIESCRRFGADKATNAVLSIKDALTDKINVYDHVYREAGIDISDDDIIFAKILAEASDAIRHANNILQEALRHGK